MNLTPAQAHDPHAEAAVIGSILLDPDRLDEVALTTRPDDFYVESYSEVYRAALGLRDRGEPVDSLTVASELQARGALERAGGRSRLFLVMEETPTALNAAHYARLVRDCACRRALHALGQQLCRQSADPGLELRDAIGAAFNALDDLNWRLASPHPASFSEDLDDVVAHLRDGQPSWADGSAVPTGFGELDALTGGLPRGGLTVLAGASDAETEVLLFELARRVAFGQALPVVFFTSRLDRRTVAERLLCAQRDQIDQAAERARRSRVTIIDSRLDAVALCSQARAAARKLERGLIVIDGQSARGVDLKRLARQLDLPVLVTARLDRCEDLSADADLVLLVCNQEAGLGVEVAKNRSGPAGQIIAVLGIDRQAERAAYYRSSLRPAAAPPGEAPASPQPDLDPEQVLIGSPDGTKRS